MPCFLCCSINTEAQQIDTEHTSTQDRQIRRTQQTDYRQTSNYRQTKAEGEKERIQIWPHTLSSWWKRKLLCCHHSLLRHQNILVPSEVVFNGLTDAPGSSSGHPESKNYGGLSGLLGFYVHSGCPSSSLCAFQTSVLSTEPSPQPLRSISNKGLAI